MLMNVGGEAVPSKNKLLTTVACARPAPRRNMPRRARVHRRGVVHADGLGIIKSAAEIEKLAASVPDSVAFISCRRLRDWSAPHWDQYARGRFRV
jgi:glycerol kinase